MNFDQLMRWALAIPGLMLTGLGFSGLGLPATQSHSGKNHHRQVIITPAPSPRGAVVPSPSVPPRPAVPTAPPVPSVTPPPTPSGAPTAASAEIASEQVCSGQSDVAKTNTVLVCLTSNARRFHGLSGVKANSALMAAAGAKVQDMLKCGYGHTACGREFNYWMTSKGYGGQCTAENIAMGQRSPHDVFVAWMNSAGHRANILNKDYRDIGVAEVSSGQGPMWVMELGGC